MKTLFYTKTLIALAVAVAAAAAAVSQAQEQPIPPPSSAGALPADIVPGSPLAEVVKMVQAGVDVGTIQSYVVNSSSPFNLDADKIIYLKDMGVPSELVNAMMDRDKILYASTVNPPVTPVTTTVVASTPDTAPPPAEVTVNYFYDTLSPYGSWVQVDGFGRCWRPTTVIYDASWRPYCDRGRWIYTDYGWYWDSDYSWGATFHYGRWFHHQRFGWCWYPDTVWSPSWVTWRSGGEYCGWAPLPPLAVFTPGIGFFYRGVSVGLDFDFGLGADCFMFLSTEHFCDRHPRNYFVAESHVTQIYRQTTVINNFNVSGHNFVNHGIPLEHVAHATHHAIEPVHVSSLPNAGRQGWRGEGYQRSFQHSSTGNNTGGNFSGGNNQLRHGPELHNDLNNTANANHHETLGQPSPGTKPNGNQFESSHSAAQQNLQGQANNSGQTVYQVQHHNQPLATGNSHLQTSQPSSATTGTTPFDHRVTQNNSQSGNGNNYNQPQINSHEQPAFQPRQLHNYDVSAPNGQQQHGASQLEPRQPVIQSQPHVDVHQNYSEPAAHSYNPPPPPPSPPAQNQPHNSNNGSNGGSNNGSNNGSDKGKPNH